MATLYVKRAGFARPMTGETGEGSDSFPGHRLRAWDVFLKLNNNVGNPVRIVATCPRNAQSKNIPHRSYRSHKVFPLQSEVGFRSGANPPALLTLPVQPVPSPKPEIHPVLSYSVRLAGNIERARDLGG